MEFFNSNSIILCGFVLVCSMSVSVFFAIESIKPNVFLVGVKEFEFIYISKFFKT